ncbi:XdhC family protein [Thalassotalea sp. LPB0316]|uniref:XdhC family protein n=1 Tax=Thalassotalea sp. LPB0316 TaxID=2769490 RepID=UPI001866C161|nr:XdhC/CoxI family protein [Thalassotalea sp. LPB0316]QOL24662.1 XdhC family protein [Thalassotalea sp. LPB0316]
MTTIDNHIESLLTHWCLHKNKCQWVLATVIETQGSAYRKAGAMMLINDLGQFFGLVSGGCLESDVMRHAKQCLVSGENKIVTYDMQDDSDISWQLGIGCGGMVKVLLQPLLESNQYLQLEQVLKLLKQGLPVNYHVNAGDKLADNTVLSSDYDSDANRLVFTLAPRVKLIIFGAGSDAIPLVNMAKQLTWHVNLIDSRPSYGRKSLFGQADNIIKASFTELSNHPEILAADIAIIMTHNLTLDAKALSLCQSLNLKYCGLLGPQHRTERVLRIAKMTIDALTTPLFNPVGFDIGGELPESIALSMLSQAHACVHGKLELAKQHNVLVKRGFKNAV